MAAYTVPRNSNSTKPWGEATFTRQRNLPWTSHHNSCGLSLFIISSVLPGNFMKTTTLATYALTLKILDKEASTEWVNVSRTAYLRCLFRYKVLQPSLGWLRVNQRPSARRLWHSPVIACRWSGHVNPISRMDPGIGGLIFRCNAELYNFY